jgi:hypothetical protein
MDLASLIFHVPIKTFVAAKHTAAQASNVASDNKIVFVFMQSPQADFSAGSEVARIIHPFPPRSRAGADLILKLGERLKTA